jgi:ribonuclease P protein component
LNPLLSTYRLKSSKEIALLVKTGKGKVKYPIKLIYNTNEQQGIRIAVVASKRLFKRAVDRNRIKRMMREAIRLELAAIQDSILPNQSNIDFLLIFVGKELPKLEHLKKSLASLLKLVYSS